MNILALKLVTGEEVLGEVVKSVPDWNDEDSEVSGWPDEFTLKNPVGITVVRGKDGLPNVGFSPFPLHSEQKKDKTITVSVIHVVYSYTPSEDFIENYKQIFGSGIILPNKQLIT